LVMSPSPLFDGRGGSLSSPLNKNEDDTDRAVNSLRARRLGAAQGPGRPLRDLAEAARRDSHVAVFQSIPLLPPPDSERKSRTPPPRPRPRHPSLFFRPGARRARIAWVVPERGTNMGGGATAVRRLMGFPMPTETFPVIVATGAGVLLCAFHLTRRGRKEGGRREGRKGSRCGALPGRSRGQLTRLAGSSMSLLARRCLGRPPGRRGGSGQSGRRRATSLPFVVAASALGPRARACWIFDVPPPLAPPSPFTSGPPVARSSTADAVACTLLPPPSSFVPRRTRPDGCGRRAG